MSGRVSKLSNTTREEKTGNITYRPFEKVPTEILGRTLSLVFESYTDKVSEEKYNVPFVLCEVSSFFAKVTISTSLLWSYLYITFDNNLAHIRRRVELRSGALPLDIYIGGMEVDHLEEFVNPILNICSNRWRNLYVALFQDYNSTEETYWTPLTWLLQRPAPQLHSVFLENMMEEEEELPALSLPSILTPTSPLKTLWMDGCSLSWEREFPPTLETLHIRERFTTETEPSEIVACLPSQSCQPLRSLSLDGVTADCDDIDVEDGVADFQDDTTLEGLEFFEVRHLNTQQAVILLSIIKTPNLRHLSLQISDDDMKEHPTFTPLLEAWKSLRFPKLEELSLGWMGCPEDSLVDFLLNLPHSMTHLNIVYEDEGTIDGVLDALESPRMEEFCGRLKRFRVAGLHLWEVINLVKHRFSKLELLEIDIRDTLGGQGKVKDGNQEETVVHLEKLRSLVPKVDLVWTRGYHRSVLDSTNSTGAKRKSKTSRQKKM